MNTDPVRDLDEALRITGGSRELADELYQQFLDELPEQMSRIETLVVQGANLSLREAIHQVKGGAAVCAVKPFIAALDDLHREVKADSRDDRLQNLLTALRQRADELLP